MRRQRGKTSAEDLSHRTSGEVINVESKVGVVSRDEKRHESDVKRETYRRDGW